PQGRQAGRPAGRAGEQVRAGHQRADCQDIRPCRAAVTARACRRGHRVKRRQFITLLGGAAAWPLTARAQQREHQRRIGVFMPGVADDPEYEARNAAFLQGLGQLGWIVGRNIRIDYRWGAGNIERYRAIAAELVALAPDVLVAFGYATASALQK